MLWHVGYRIHQHNFVNPLGCSVRASRRLGALVGLNVFLESHLLRLLQADARSPG